MGARSGFAVAIALLVCIYVFLPLLSPSHQTLQGTRVAQAFEKKAQTNQDLLGKQGSRCFWKTSEEKCQVGLFAPPFTSRITAQFCPSTRSSSNVVEMRCLSDLEWCKAELLPDLQPALAHSVLGGTARCYPSYNQESSQKIKVKAEDHRRRCQTEGRQQEGPNASICSSARRHFFLSYVSRSSMGELYTYEEAPGTRIGSPSSSILAATTQTAQWWRADSCGRKRGQEGTRDDRAAEAFPGATRVYGLSYARGSRKAPSQAVGDQRASRSDSCPGLQNQQHEEGSGKSQRASKVRRRYLDRFHHPCCEEDQRAEDQLCGRTSRSYGALDGKAAEAEGGPGRTQDSSSFGTSRCRGIAGRLRFGRADAIGPFWRDGSGREGHRASTEYADHRPDKSSYEALCSTLAIQKKTLGRSQPGQECQGSQNHMTFNALFGRSFLFVLLNAWHADATMRSIIPGCGILSDDEGGSYVTTFDDKDHYQIWPMFGTKHWADFDAVFPLKWHSACEKCDASVMPWRGFEPRIGMQQDLNRALQPLPPMIASLPLELRSLNRHLEQAPFLKAAFTIGPEGLGNFSSEVRPDLWPMYDELLADQSHTAIDLVIFGIASFVLAVCAFSLWTEVCVFAVLSALALLCFCEGLSASPSTANHALRRCPLRVRQCRVNRKARMPFGEKFEIRCPLFLWLMLSSHLMPCIASQPWPGAHISTQENAKDDYAVTGPLTMYQDEASLLSTSQILFTLGTEHALTSQELMEQPPFVQVFEDDPIMQEAARLEEALHRTWQQFNLPADAYACLMRTRRLPTMPPNICSRIVRAAPFALANAAMQHWEDLSDREWGLSPVNMAHPVFLGYADVVILIVEPTDDNSFEHSSTAAVEIVAEDSRGALTSAMFAHFAPDPFHPEAFMHAWEIIPCFHVVCEFWVGEFPVYPGQTFETYAGMHLQIFLPRFTLTSQLAAAGVTGTRWLQFWSDRNQPVINPRLRTGLRPNQSPISISGQLTMFRVPKPSDHASQIYFDVRTTTVFEVLERKTLDQWMDVSEDHWQWTHADDSWHDSPFLEQFAHVMLVYDTRLIQRTILTSVESDPVQPPVRIHAGLSEEITQVASLVILSGAARDCLIEEHECFYHLDGSAHPAHALVRVKHGSFFRVIVRSKDDSDHNMCGDVEFAEDLVMMQTRMSCHQSTDLRIHALANRHWIRATVWMNAHALNDHCHSSRTTIMFKIPVSPESRWEDVALETFVNVRPTTCDRMNSRTIKLVWPQPTPLFNDLGLVQLIAVDYVPSPSDFPLLIDIQEPERTDRTLVHFSLTEGRIFGTHIVQKRHMTERCEFEGWCLIRYGDTEYQIRDQITLMPFTYLAIVFVPLPFDEDSSTGCDTRTPNSESPGGSPHTRASIETDSSFAMYDLEDLEQYEGSIFLQLSAFINFSLDQSTIINGRLPPPGNGPSVRRMVRFDPLVEVWYPNAKDSCIIRDHKITNPFLADFVCTTDAGSENPFVLSFMLGLGWHPKDSSGLRLTLSLRDLIPPPATGLPLDLMPTEAPTIDEGVCSQDSFPSLPLQIDLGSSLGIETPWATCLSTDMEGLDLHPFTKLALEMCPQKKHGVFRRFHIYTDGSFIAPRIKDATYQPAIATWSFVVIGEDPHGSFAFVGYLAGDVILEKDTRWETQGIGAARLDPLTAERCAIYWALAWAHHVLTEPSCPVMPSFFLHFDCTAAGWEASGTQGPTFDNMSILAIAIRSLAIRLSARTEVQYRHIHGHSGQPWNEFADVAARSRAKSEIPDLTPDHFLTPLRTNSDFLLWSTSVEAVPNSFEPPCAQQSLWLRGFDACLPDSYQWSPLPPVATKAAHNCAFKGLVATYNVMTLRKRGALELLRQQCDRKGLHVIGLQETRDRESHFWPQGKFFRFVSAADSQGQGGLQLWIHKESHFLYQNGKPIRLTAKAFTVVHATPRILRVHCHAGGIHLVFVVAHAPHSADPAAADWWSDFDQRCGDIQTDTHVVMMIDANCRLQGFEDDVVGSAGPPLDAKHQDQSDAFHSIATRHGMFVPSTFASHHRGDHYTWMLGAAKARLDYVVLPKSWQQRVSTWVETDIRSGATEWDHSMLIAQIRADFPSLRHHSMRPIRFDREALKTPEGKSLCKRIFTEMPRIPYEVNPTLHCHLIEEYLQHSLVKHFPFSRRQKKKSYICNDTYEQVLALRSCRREARTHSDQHARQTAFCAFYAWKHLLRLNSGRNTHHTLLKVSKISRFIQTIDLSWARLLCTQLKTQRLLDTLLKRDHAKHRTELAESLAKAPPAEFYETLKPLLPKHRRGLFSAQKLPGICDSEGNPSTSVAQTARIFQTYFGKSEEGEMVLPCTLQDRCIRDQDADVRAILEASDTLAIADLPTLQLVESKFRRLSANKAPGPDQLPSELFRNDPQGASLSYYGLILKTVAFGAEPLQWKGGVVKALHKKGDPRQAKNWRNILLASIPGKVAHSTLRDAVNRSYQANALACQFGGRKNASIQVPTLAIRAFQNLQKSKCHSCALLFVDGVEAFYRMIREVCFHFPSIDALHERLKQRPIPNHRLHAILHQAQEDSSMKRLGISHHLELVLKALHTNTWFVMENEAEQICATNTGSRPGDPLADICFNVVMSRAIRAITMQLQSEELDNSVTLQANAPVPQSKPFEQEFRFSSQAWVDDLIFLAADPCPHAWLHKVQRTTAIVQSELAALGIELNMSAGKTEVLLQLRGKGSRGLKRCIAFDQSGFVNVDPIDGLQPLSTTPRYRYLGSILSHHGGCAPDIRYRTAQTFAVLKSLRRPVFANPKLAPVLKSRVLHAVVLSKFMATAGSWCLQTDQELRTFRNALMRIYRYVHHAWFFQQPGNLHVSHQQIADDLGALYPDDWIAIHSLRTLTSLVKIAPGYVWALLLCDDVWKNQMQQAIDWLRPTCFPFPDAGNIELDLAMVVECIEADSVAFKRSIGRAQKAYIAQWTDAVCDSMERVHAMVKVDQPSTHATTSEMEGYRCGVCAKHLPTFRAVKVHLHRQHSIHSDSFCWAQQTRCEVCLLEFHQKKRLQHHFEHGGQACLHALMQRYEAPPDHDSTGEADLSHLPFVRAEGPIAPWFEGVPDKKGTYPQPKEGNVQKPQASFQSCFDGDTERLRSLRWAAPAVPPGIFWPIKVVLHLFSGRRRQGDIQQCLEFHAKTLSFQLAVLSLDIAVDAVHGDLSRADTQAYWVSRTLDGYVYAFVAGPPCETFSKSRFHPGGPPPIRSALYPFGILGICAKFHRQVTMGSNLASFVLHLGAAALAVGARGLLEHPAPFELPDATCIWKFPLLRKLMEHPGAHFVQINQEDYGQISVKPTGLLGLNLYQFDKVLKEYALPDIFKRSRPLKMGCRLEGGMFTTAPLKEYPAGLCDALAASLLHQWPDEDVLKGAPGCADGFSHFLSEIRHMECVLPTGEGKMQPDYHGCWF